MPEEFGGKQIILNSGRLIFNSKESGILGFSNGPIDFSTLDVFGVSAKQRLDLYSPTISVGRRSKTKNINMNTSNVTVRGDSGKTLVRASKITLLGPTQDEDVRRAGKGQPVARVTDNEFGPRGEEAASFIVGTGQDIKVSKAVKGNELNDLLKEILDITKATTLAVQKLASITALINTVTPGAPAGQVAAEITENILKDINARYETLPKILSKVVELE